jgi:hypothetical protein
MLAGQALGQLLHGLIVARGEMKTAAFRSQVLGDHEADALRGAGDQHRLAFEINIHRRAH